MNKNNIPEIEKLLNSKTKTIALVAPSFVVDFEYPQIISQLKQLGFDKVTELTFGAKMINREYHKLLENSKELIISSACPGIVNTIKNTHPEYAKNLAKIDSPVEAMSKICKKHFPEHKTIFLSPCDFKKIEAEQSNYIDYVIDYEQLKELFKKYKIKPSKKHEKFDKFYNDYTKIYPLSGGLAKTAHLKQVVKQDEIKIIDGISEVQNFLKNPAKKIKFLDCLFCKGGCIGGPHTNKQLSIKEKHKKVTKYMEESKKENIPENRKGLINKAKGIKFSQYK